MKFADLKPFYNKVFRIEELRHYFNESLPSIRTQLSRLCKNGKLARLKRNCYTFIDFHPEELLMAQQMISPSYHSMEAVLSWNGIIPEGVFAYTLVTSQKTQAYANIFGRFTYSHLKPDLFFGITKREDGVWMAESEKALLDYMYLRSYKLDPNFICFQEERFDLTAINWNKISEWAPKYGMKKLLKLATELERYSESPQYQAHR